MQKISEISTSLEDNNGDDFLKAYLDVKKIENPSFIFNEVDIDRIKSAINIAITQFEKEKSSCNNKMLKMQIDGIIMEYNQILSKME